MYEGKIIILWASIRSIYQVRAQIVNRDRLKSRLTIG